MKNIDSKPCLGVILVSFALMLAGCSGPHYERTDITDVSQSDLGATVSLTTVSLIHGGAAKAVITPYDSDHKPMASSVASKDPSVVEVVAGLDAGEYIFLASSVGTTDIEFSADGEVVAIARAVVTEQASP